MRGEALHNTITKVYGQTQRQRYTDIHKDKGLWRGIKTKVYGQTQRQRYTDGHKDKRIWTDIKTKVYGQT